jgi:hypothetical protein
MATGVWGVDKPAITMYFSLAPLATTYPCPLPLILRQLSSNWEGDVTRNISSTALPLLVIAAAVGGFLASGCGGVREKPVSSPTASVSRTPASTATAVPTLDPASVGRPIDRPFPVPQIEQLPDDTTGGTIWAETGLAGAVMRHPGDDKEWEVSVDEGSQYSGFDGIPNVRVTHLSTGKARVYSLLTGQVMFCSDRSAVLAEPTEDQIADLGEPEDCPNQVLSAIERAVFEHVQATGRYEYYFGPPVTAVPTVPGWSATPFPFDSSSRIKPALRNLLL